MVGAKLVNTKERVFKVDRDKRPMTSVPGGPANTPMAGMATAVPIWRDTAKRKRAKLF